MKNIFRKLTFTFIAISLTCLSSFAASPGALDFSFSNDGIVTTNISVTTIGNDVIVQPDDKILVGGTAELGVSGRVFYVARYNSVGNLDTTFNSSGVATIDFPSANGEEVGGKLAIQADGKILIAGTGGGQNVNVARLNANGTPDTTFDGDGKANFFNTGAGPVADIDVAPDGKIVITRGDGVGGSNCLKVLRLTTNGILDTSFASTGDLQLNPNIANVFCGLRTTAIQSDGKLVVAGTILITQTDRQFLVVRVNTNGTLDTIFDTDGALTVSFPGDGFGRSIAVQPNGRIIVAGFSSSGSGVKSAQLARLNTNGSLDTTFDTDGKVTVTGSLLQNSDGVDCAIQPDGKILYFDSSGRRSHLIRLNSNGSLDNSFGQAGIYRLPNTTHVALALQSDGKFLLVGTEGTFANQNETILLTRHTANIQPTASSDFDGDGTTDTAVFRPSTRDWFILRSTDNTFAIFQFGLTGDVPIDGDFDGDGRSDLAIFRPSSGAWFFQRSSDNTFLGAQFGQVGDKPIPGDYDKDGKTDIAFFRPSTANWFVLRSSSNFSTFFGFQFGATGDIPITQRGS
jgi:uncharacterized delta-60 repeat protein